MDERYYDLYSLIYMIALDTVIIAFIALGYLVYSWRRTSNKSSRSSQTNSSGRIIYPFGDLNNSNNSNDLSPFNQPLMDGYHHEDDNENDNLFDTCDYSNKITSNNPLDLRRFFSIGTNAASKIAPHTPSTFMRRSFNLDNLYQKEGDAKQLSFFGWIKEVHKLDIDSIKTIWNYDGYIYIYYLRMCAIFFLILSILNMLCLYVYNYVDLEENSQLTPIQKITILSMFGSKTKTLLIYAITVVNSIAGNIFIFRFMNLFKRIEFQASHEDYGDYEVSKTTIMIHEIPSYLPIFECNTLISQIFKSRFGREFEAVHTVGKYNKVKLDNFYLKRNFLEEQIESYNERKMRNLYSDDKITIYNKGWVNTLLRCVMCCSWWCKRPIGSKRVNMVDYYLDKIKYYDQQILKLKSKGISSNQGISFVTFSSEDWVYETLLDFDLIKDISK